MIDLVKSYHDRLAADELHPDAAQEHAVRLLQAFAVRLTDYKPPAPSLLSRLLPIGTAEPPQGLYIYGSVGRGKSMLMDLFFAEAQVAKKRRVHFHQFMLEIQERLHRLQSAEAPDILPRVAREIASGAWLLCFDEFHVGNIADAMILGRLFEALFDAGAVVVATSNWPPDQLYKDGLQRDQFLPFIDLIRKHMQVYFLDGAVDHRFEQTRGVPCWFNPLGSDATRMLQQVFFRLTDNSDPEKIELPVQGRVLRITHAAKGVGFFNFDELCRMPLGAADFLAIAGCMHTVLIDGVPRMADAGRNEIMRFVNMIDVFYEAKVQLYIAAAAPLQEIEPTNELEFSFERTVSRLVEMQGDEYRKAPHLTGNADDH
jgi:cell division protein ZapE